MNNLTITINLVLDPSGAAPAKVTATAVPVDAEPIEAQPVVESAAADPTPVEEAPAEDPAPVEEPKTRLTQADVPPFVRRAMAETRRRIEGEDYETNTEGEGRKTYHKPLTRLFQAIASQVSDNATSKPSELSPEQAETFIARVKELGIIAPGQLGVKCPF